MKKFNKYICIISTIVISIGIMVFLTNSKINLMVEIEYKSQENARIQLFYDNLQGEKPFNEEYSITTDIKDTESKFDKIQVKVPYERINKLRIDLDGIKKPVQIKKICIYMLGVQIKEFAFLDVYKDFNATKDVEITMAEKSISLWATGDDPSIKNYNVGLSNSRIVTGIRLLLCTVIAVITLILIRVIDIIDIKTNMKDRNERALIVVFSLIIIIPNLIYKFIPGDLKGVSENRILKEKPVMNFNQMAKYPKVYEEYYNDNLPFKDDIVKLNSLFKYRILNSSPEKYVIKGIDDWLFYDSKHKGDADTIADYQGTNLYSIEELEDVKDKLLNIKKTLDESGTELFVFIAPNKSQVYSEFMPKEYIKSKEESRVEQLINYIRNNTDVNMVYPKDELMKTKEKYDVYYKLDSHWNEVGAYAGFTELMKSINGKNDTEEEIRGVEDVKISEKKITNGDLARMIKLNGILHDKLYTVDDFKTDIEVENTEEEGSMLLRYESNNLNGKKAVVFRDSFFDSMIPYVNKEFEESLFIWNVFNKEIVTKEKPDIVIIESVERLTRY